MRTKGNETVQLLHQWGGRFVQVKGKNPGIVGKGWQDKNSGEKEALGWLQDGLSVGLITGEKSDGLVLLDVDGRYQDGEFVGKGLEEFLWSFPDLYDTPIIVRKGADKGKLLLRPKEQPPRRKVKVNKEKPYFEILSFGNMGVVAGPHVSGVPYEMIHAQFEPKEVEMDILMGVFKEWTGKTLRRNQGKLGALQGRLDENLIGVKEKERLENLFQWIIGVTNGTPGSDDNYLGYCPAHADNRRSFSVGISRDKIFVHCFTGCEYRAILKSLGLSSRELESYGSREMVRQAMANSAA